jgi:hypothetical protein
VQAASAGPAGRERPSCRRPRCPGGLRSPMR